jgi:hypothetical protein
MAYPFTFISAAVCCWVKVGCLSLLRGGRYLVLLSRPRCDNCMVGSSSSAGNWLVICQEKQAEFEAVEISDHRLRIPSIGSELRQACCYRVRTSIRVLFPFLAAEEPHARVLSGGQKRLAFLEHTF